MDIKQLRYFVAVAETLHFGRAAQQLHLSQPPLSRQIASLEQELGVTLLERHSRRAALTFAGRRLLEDARLALDLFDRACTNARRAHSGELGELSVGFMMHAAHTLIPRATRRYRAAFPNVELTLREVLPTVLEHDVAQGRFDIGVVFAPVTVDGLVTSAIFEEVLCVALNAAHPLSLKANLNAQDLHGEQFVATLAQTTPALRAAIAEYFANGRHVPAIGSKCNFNRPSSAWSQKAWDWVSCRSPWRDWPLPMLSFGIWRTRRS
ncbi:LysR family transcriptional regulator [Mesorhizobium sp. Cs1330R2N1]|uniref:LysR family transcriptional regulator n=1 Tax=Mesorhizobium argentiipisi TaxID=3015175 RepID=A0ABU8KME6_9HYPH